MKNQLDFFQKTVLFSIAVVGFIFLWIDYAQFSPIVVDYKAKAISYLISNFVDFLMYAGVAVGASCLIFKPSKLIWSITAILFAGTVLKQYYSFYLMTVETNFGNEENRIVMFLTFGLIVVLLFVLSLLLNFLVSKKLRSYLRSKKD